MIFKHNGSQGREHIDAIELYRVFPTFFNGLEVESAGAWIDLARQHREQRELGQQFDTPNRARG